MGWEARKTPGSAYYYQSRRDPAGRVVKIYVGKGCGARKLAELVARGKARKAAARRELGAAEASIRAADTLMKELEATGGVLFEAFLLSEGFHRANYGPWRRRRGHGRQRATEPGTDF